MMLLFALSDIEILTEMKLQKQARTVHEIDLETLNLHKVDGKNFSLPPFVEKD